MQQSQNGTESVNPHKRAKEPEKIRRLILLAAEMLAVRSGEESVTFAKIAKSVGVSTGAVIHHFPNKKALLSAVVEMETDALQAEYEKACQANADHSYLFTRIYIDNILSGSEKFSTLIKLSLTSQELSQRWQNRMSEILAKADPSDRSEAALLLRFCADGIWLSRITTASDAYTQEAVRLVNQKLADLRRGSSG